MSVFVLFRFFLLVSLVFSVGVSQRTGLRAVILENASLSSRSGCSSLRSVFLLSDVPFNTFSLEVVNDVIRLKNLEHVPNERIDFYELLKLSDVTNGQLRTGGLIFTIIGFIIIWFLKN